MVAREVHQYKKIKDVVSSTSFEAEMKKAASPNDLFMLFTTARCDLFDTAPSPSSSSAGATAAVTQPVSSTAITIGTAVAATEPVLAAIVDPRCWQDYFGPFAGRAFPCLDRPHINTASRSVLEAVNGIGPGAAEAILQERHVRGPFTSYDNALTRLAGKRIRSEALNNFQWN